MIKIIDHDIGRFFEVPFHCNPADTLYVSPMKMDLKRFLSRANPLFGAGDNYRVMVCEKGGKLSGRLVVHEHAESNKAYQERRAHFGYFESIDDLEVARSLFNEAEAWARARKLEVLGGNFNLTAMQQVGVTVDGFEQMPYMDQTYTPQHHAKLLRALGYAARFPMTTFELDLQRFDPATLAGDKAQALLESGLYFGTLQKRDFAGSLEATRLVLNDGFAKNPMFVPLTSAEMLFQAKDMVYIIDEDISCLVREDGVPIGVVVCVPDINPFLTKTRSRIGLMTPYHFLTNMRRRDRAVIIFYSVCRRWHGRGLNGAMLYNVTTALKRKGYKTLGITWIADENKASLRQVERLGAKPMHRLNLFEKVLSSVG
jgi:hypothetical protein